MELAKGKLPTDIADELNESETPVRSKSVGNSHTRTKDEIKRNWTRDSIVKVGRDKTYLGYVISEKSKKLSYKSKKVILTKEEDQIIVPNMHEPLIDKETFDKVQELIDSRTNTRTNKHEFLLKGLLECAECGKKISVLVTKQKSGNEIMYTRCNTYASMTRLKLCTPHSNNCEKLTNKILETIQTRLQQYQKEEEYFLLAKDIKDRTVFKKNMIQNQIVLLTNKIEQQNSKIDQIYDDKLNNIIADFIFTEKSKEFEKELNEVESNLENAIGRLNNIKGLNDKERIVYDAIENLKKNGITKEDLRKLIRRITVFCPNEIREENKEEYGVSDEVYNEILENGGLVFQLNFLHQFTITHRGM